MSDDAPRHPTWVLAATILGSSMVFIDGTAVSVALSALQRDLGAGVSDLQWIIESYLLLLASLLLVGGAMGDRFGRKRIYGLGILVFTAASVGCALAPSAGALIAARAVQGVGGALMVPGSLAIISAAFTGSARGRAIGTWSGFTAVTNAVGQLLGGWLVDHASWRAIFYLNVPLAIATLAMLAWRVPESRAPGPAAPLDWAGALTATAGLGGLVYGITEGPSRGWGHPGVIAGLVGGVAALAAFLVIEAKGPAPMMPLGLFRSPTFSGTNGLTLLLYAALGGTLTFLPYTMIQLHGYSATATGASMLPMIVLMFSLSRWAGGLIDRHGARLPLVVGPLVAGVGFALFALPGTGGSFWTTFFPAIVALGLGMTIAVAPLTTAVMSAVSTDRAGVASGINNAVSRVGGLVAVAVFGSIIVATFGRSLDARLSALPVPAAERQALVAHRERLVELAVPAAWPVPVRAQAQAAIAESYLAGFRMAMGLAALMAFMSALVAGIWVSPRRGGPSHEEATASGG